MGCPARSKTRSVVAVAVLSLWVERVVQPRVLRQCSMVMVAIAGPVWVMVRGAPSL